VIELKERIPPQAVETEMAILGTAMLYEESVFTAMEQIKEEHFYKTAHQKMFKAMSPFVLIKRKNLVEVGIWPSKADFSGSSPPFTI